MSSPPSRFPARILVWLESHPNSDSHQVAEAVHITRRTATSHLRALHQAGVIFISGWGRFDDRGSRLWTVGDRRDSPKPPAQTANQAYRRRRRRLTKIFGESAGDILLPRRKGGATVIRNGDHEYRRGKPRGNRWAA